jgi:hypothetical protein
MKQPLSQAGATVNYPRRARLTTRGAVVEKSIDSELLTRTKVRGVEHGICHMASSECAIDVVPRQTIIA